MAKERKNKGRKVLKSFEELTTFATESGLLDSKPMIKKAVEILDKKIEEKLKDE